MNMKMRRFTALALAIVSILSLSAAANAGARASEIIKSVSAGLSTNKKATFTIGAKLNCASIGLTKYTLYKSNGTEVTSKTVNSYSTGYNYSTSIVLSSYITAGNSYYVSGEFYADVETGTARSGSRSY